MSNIKFIKISNQRHLTLIKKNSKIVNSKKIIPALFFDRDGVIIKDKNYISNAKDVEINVGVEKLLNISKNLGWLNIIVTNQSGISRGFFNWKDYEKVTNEIFFKIGDPKLIDGIYANGEPPNSQTKNISWRKPSPNMILKASEDFNIDINCSIIIGDRISDLEAGKRAGIKKFVHVLTGHGREERDEIIEKFKVFNYNLILLNDLTFFPHKDLLFKTY